MNLKHNSPATKVTDTTNIFWVAAALCWQSAGCNYIGPTQTRPAFYWLQLHWGKYDILTEFRVCCSSVRMKQLQFLLSNNRGPEVFARKKTPTINCHQNDNYHDHHWDETLRTVPVASESIRFYISTYSARFTLMYIPPYTLHLSQQYKLCMYMKFMCIGTVGTFKNDAGGTERQDWGGRGKWERVSTNKIGE